MAEDFIQLPADGVGKKLRTEKVTVGLNEVHQEVLTLALSNGDLLPGTLADGVLVNLGANNDVTVPGVATLAEQQIQSASLSVLDDWDEADRAKVNPIVGQAGVAAGAGAVGATTQRTTLASDDPAVASLGVIDDWDESDRAKVNPIAGQAGVQGGSGPITALTQRVVVATDQPPIPVTGGGGGTEYAEDTPSGNGDLGTFTLAKRQDAPAADVDTDGDRARLTVDALNRLWVNPSSVTQPISAATLPLPAGAATLAEQQTQSASLSVLDDWDESDRAKVNPIVGQAGVAGGTGIRGATTQRVTIATDDEIVMSLSTLDDWDESDRAKVNPIVGQAGVQGGSGLVTATTQRVVIATDQPAIPVTGGGGTQYAEDTVAGDGDLGTFALARRRDAPTADVDTDGDRARLTVDALSRLWVNPSSVTQPISAASLPLPAGAATLAEQQTQSASLSTLDDWDESDRAKVNPIVGQAGVDGGSGTVSAATQRVVLATDVPLPTGSNNIGDVDVLSMPAVTIGAFPDNEPFNVSQWGGNAVTGGAGGVAAGTPRITLASDDPAVASLSVLDDWDETDRAKVNIIAGQAGISAGAGLVAANTPRVTHASDDPVTTALQIMDDWDNAASDGASVSGDVAHDAVDAGEPVKIGGVAVSGSASPTSVAASDRTRFIANQHGIPYHIAGHPNLITREYDFGASAQTDVNLADAAVAADERIYVTRFEALNDNATTAAGVSVRCGFGTANVPTASATGVSGMIGTHPGLAPGSGIMCGTGAGIIAVGAAGEEPRLTSSAATGGNLHVLISYFKIDETP